jgi:hypothetical protein
VQDLPLRYGNGGIGDLEQGNLLSRIADRCLIHLPLRRSSTHRCIRFLGVVLSSGPWWTSEGRPLFPSHLSTSLPRGWRPDPCRDGGERAEARAARRGHPVRGGHRAGHRVGPERQAAMAAEAASRTLAEVGRRRRRVTAEHPKPARPASILARAAEGAQEVEILHVGAVRDSRRVGPSDRTQRSVSKGRHPSRRPPMRPARPRGRSLRRWRERPQGCSSNSSRLFFRTSPYAPPIATRRSHRLYRAACSGQP